MKDISPPGQPQEPSNRIAKVALALAIVGAAHAVAYFAFLALMCRTSLGIGPLYGQTERNGFLMVLELPLVGSVGCFRSRSFGVKTLWVSCIRRRCSFLGSSP